MSAGRAAAQPQRRPADSARAQASALERGARHAAHLARVACAQRLRVRRAQQRLQRRALPWRQAARGAQRGRAHALRELGIVRRRGLAPAARAPQRLRAARPVTAVARLQQHAIPRQAAALRPCDAVPGYMARGTGREPSR